ncbi:MAG: TolC family protein [Cohaesibacteraceae bacterium]|nr:TolC family protein [Cohaesibacteraceae bacterium]
MPLAPVGGSVGTKRSASVKIQLSLPFNLGFTSINSSRASNSDYTAATSRLADARYQVDETVLNAWEKYETAKATARLLRDQASLAHAFLKLARQERKLGNRSLIDVLAGESAHFNALSDTLSMDADVLVAAFEILQATGQLVGPDADLIKRTGNKSPKRNRWTSVNLH